jgi:CHAT domain
LTRPTNSVLAAARAIRPYLPRLVGADAVTVDREITALLIDARDGADVEEALLNLLRRYPATHSWTAAFMQHGHPPEIDDPITKNFGLPGMVSPVSARKYCCPAGDYDWWRPRVGDQVPTCPSHSLALQPAGAQELREGAGQQDVTLGRTEPRTEPTPATEAAPRPRYLVADLPERAPAGRRLSVIVHITLAEQADGLSSRLKRLDVPPEGRTVTITVSAPGLAPYDDLEQDLQVPADGDSEPVRFGFRAARVGLHTVTVRAFAGGTFLGELAAQISVEVGAALEEGATHRAAMATLASELGEVTMQVSLTDDNRYSFQLIGERLFPVEYSRRLAGDPTEVLESLVSELRAMAAGTSEYTTPSLIRNRFKNLGAQLWADAVPEAIRTQFWAQAGRIRSFTVASDMDSLPWELLYPVDGDNENGFLVEQFPVVRRVYGQGRVLRLPLTSAAYVVPSGSPRHADDEVQAVRRRLGPGVSERGVVQRLEDLNALLLDPPSVLHFASHNQFTDTGGSVLGMEGGPFRPSDLAVAVQKRGLSAASPLIFFNACRTAGEIPGLGHMMGWAKQFMGAGAGAFLGTLWAVRSSSAKVFADAFYQAFVTQRLPLGPASVQARQAISADDSDPTWLAYSIYGNPSATISVQESS